MGSARKFTEVGEKTEENSALHINIFNFSASHLNYNHVSGQ